MQSRKERLITLVSAIWCVGSIILALFIMEEEYLEAHEFVSLLLAFLAPVVIYWAVRWVKGGEKSEKEVEKERKYADVLAQQPALSVANKLEGLGLKLYLLTFFAALVTAGFGADFFINQYMIDEAYEHGWGNIPQLVIVNVEQWSTYSQYVRAGAGIAFLIIVAVAYTDIKVQLEGTGLKGIKCSVGMLALWLIIPFANFVMPWRAFGALDRAAKFAAKSGRSGDLWNKKGFRGVSVRSVFMGFMFVITGSFATLYNKEVASLAARTPSDVYEFVSLIRNNNELLVGMALAYALYMGSILIYFFLLNRNVRSIKASTEV
jgi:hypothetical protein